MAALAMRHRGLLCAAHIRDVAAACVLCASYGLKVCGVYTMPNSTKMVAD